jgi:hypothetical protein
MSTTRRAFLGDTRTNLALARVSIYFSAVLRSV